MWRECAARIRTWGERVRVRVRSTRVGGLYMGTAYWVFTWETESVGVLVCSKSNKFVLLWCIGLLKK